MIKTSKLVKYKISIQKIETYILHIYGWVGGFI